MKSVIFVSQGDIEIPAISTEQMREVDRIAVEDYGIALLQMMENAGRNLAELAISTVASPSSSITILAGSGGNGGGGICAARHLWNKGYDVKLVISKNEADLRGAPAIQLNIIKAAGFRVTAISDLQSVCDSAGLIIDAIIGYSLQGKPHGTPKKMIVAANSSDTPILSLDMPSGIDATTGEPPGEHIVASRTLTLALPKLGLSNTASGELFLGDIGIPPQLYQGIDLQLTNIFSNDYVIAITIK